MKSILNGINKKDALTLMKASELKVGMVFKHNFFGWVQIYEIEKGIRKNGNVYFELYFKYDSTYFGETQTHYNAIGKNENTLVEIKEVA